MRGGIRPSIGTSLLISHRCMRLAAHTPVANQAGLVERKRVVAWPVRHYPLNKVVQAYSDDPFLLYL